VSAAPEAAVTAEPAAELVLARSAPIPGTVPSVKVGSGGASPIAGAINVLVNVLAPFTDRSRGGGGGITAAAAAASAAAAPAAAAAAPAAELGERPARCAIAVMESSGVGMTPWLTRARKRLPEPGCEDAVDGDRDGDMAAWESEPAAASSL